MFVDFSQFTLKIRHEKYHPTLGEQLDKYVVESFRDGSNHSVYVSCTDQRKNICCVQGSLQKESSSEKK